MNQSGKSVTMNDVAREANVSNATVSRYLNNKTFVDREKAAEIERAIKLLDYRPNRIAKWLKMNRSMQIMIVVPDIQNPFYSSMYKTVQSIAYPQGYTVILFNTDDRREKELESIRLVQELGCEGLIFCSTNDFSEVIDELKGLRIPVVTSNIFGQHIFDTIHSKKGQSVYLGTRHLIDCGHRNIGYAGGNPESVLNKRRKEGYERAMGESELERNPRFVYEESFTIEGGLSAGIYFRGLGILPTAIVCANDLIAMGVIQSFQRNGIRVPADVSVVGVDNIEYAAFCNPAITTVSNDSSEFAKNAMDLLFSRISGEYLGEPREVFSSRNLIVRESSAPLVR